MKFNLVRPCPECPFRTDCLSGWLGEDRAVEIVNALSADHTFSCHKTLGETDEGETVTVTDSEHCAGAMVMLERVERPNQMMRIAERLGMYDHTRLDMESPVFDDFEDFISHHGAPVGGSRTCEVPA